MNTVAATGQAIVAAGSARIAPHRAAVDRRSISRSHSGFHFRFSRTKVLDGCLGFRANKAYGEAWVSPLSPMKSRCDNPKRTARRKFLPSIR